MIIHVYPLFLDTLGCYFLLPQIILPTRKTETSKILIDNIFSNITESSVSGNFLDQGIKLLNCADEIKEIIIRLLPR